ncbi:MAG: hypothetical protein ACK493_08125 [Planctomycetota bacterium]|jgi:hypothetical protein
MFDQISPPTSPLRRPSRRRAVLAIAIAICFGCGYFAADDLAAWQTEKIFPGELAGLDQSESLLIDDDQPLAAQSGFLVRLLYRARKATPESLRSFATYSQSVSLGELIRAPKQYRGWVFRLSGQAKSAEWVSTGEAGEEVLGKFCRVRIVTESGQEVVVYSVDAPRAWTNGKARSEMLDEPCACFGFFAVRPRGEDGEASSPIFVARRVEWYPKGTKALSEQGFDSGLLDMARIHNLRPFSEEETEAFYALLNASGKADFANALNGSLPVGFFELLASPQEKVGSVVEFEATVRRVVPVAIAPKHGVSENRFYQIDAFFRLGDTPVEIRGANGEAIRYQTRFPVTIDAVHLVGEPSSLVGQRIRVRGWLYRFWKYDSEFVDQKAAGSGQLAPLIMANQIELLPEVGGGTVARLAYLAIAAAAMAIGFTWWVTRRQVPGRSERPPLPERIDL